MNFESIHERLTSGDPEKRLQSVTDLRERIEIVHTSEFSKFLSILFPAFKTLLSVTVRPQMVENSDNRFRNVLLEILNRLPNNDVLKPYVGDLLHLAMNILKVDNEENALICLRIIFDLHKNYRPALESDVQPFLNQVQEFYRGLEKTLAKVFAAKNDETKTEKSNAALDRSSSTLSSSSMSLDKEKPEPSPATAILHSTESFKVLTECPLIVMLLFQLYPRYIEKNIPALIPLMMKALTLRTPESVRKTHRTRYAEFLACQVKTLSFLTYLLRGFSSVMRTFEDSIGSSVIQLLASCPPEAVTTRKELLVATRHILATDFRKGFFSHVDTLSDEKVLIGKGRACHQILRPLAYSTLADLVHHVRNKLTLQQLSKIIYIFSRNIHDATLPTSIQTTSVRLLLNLMDYIFHNQETDGSKGRALLVRILETLVSKFSTLVAYIPKVVESDALKTKDKGRELIEGALSKLQQSSLLQEDETEIKYEVECKVLVGAAPEVVDTIEDVKSLMKTMILGLKTVIWCVTNYRRRQETKRGTAASIGQLQMGTPNDNSKFSDVAISDEERCMVARFLKRGLQCFLVYSRCADKTSVDEKEVLDHFAGAFTVLETHTFRDIFIKYMPMLFDSILERQVMLTIPQHFLANSNASSCFAEMMLEFLLTRLDDLTVLPGSDNIEDANERASVILRLFKIVFGSVTLFATNEPVLRPHLRAIVSNCLRRAMEMKQPLNYYFLLRALFRSISGRKFELFYKEFQPLLPGLLSGLIRLQSYTIDPEAREVLLELSLTVPARLSSLLQFLPLLMRPLVLAIGSKGELVNLGLRTLEFWVDNLNPEFLFPIMSGQDYLLTDLIETLCSHLHPPPYPYGMLAMRLLGKLGGRNRRFLIEPINLSYTDHQGPGVALELHWSTETRENDPKFELPSDFIVERVCKLLQKLCKSGKEVDDTTENPASLTHHKKQAFQFLTKCLVCIMRTDDMPDALQLVVQSDIGEKKPQEDGSNTITSCLESSEGLNGTFPHQVRNRAKSEKTRAVLNLLFDAIFESTSDKDLQSEAEDFVKHIATHFAMVILSHSQRFAPDKKALDTLSKLPAPVPSPRGLVPGRDANFDARVTAMGKAQFGPTELIMENSGIDVFAFAGQIVSSLSSIDEAIVKTASDALATMAQVAASLYDEDPQKAVQMGGVLFGNLAEQCLHACYGKTWQIKIGGCRGIRKLCETVHDDWIHEHQLKVIRAILFVLADHQPEATVTVAHEAVSTLEAVLRKCHPLTNDPDDTMDTEEAKGEEDAEMEVEEEEEEGKKAHSDEENVSLPKNLSETGEELVKLLAIELLSPKELVRKQVRETIHYLSRFYQCTPSGLIYAHHGTIRTQVFVASLRQLPPSIQVGYMDAVAYGLELAPPIFTMSKELLNFLQEVWLLTSAEDPSSQCVGTGGGMSNVLGDISAGQLYPCELSHSVCLRVAAIACIRAAFMTNPEVLNQNQDARNKFVSVFFRSLTGQPDEVVTAAQSALTDIIEINKRAKDTALPKDLLQACLRPVLLNLADYRKLTLPLLQGLARLLMLLSSCFNVTLGEKLLEHLRQWKDPEKIKATEIWVPGEEPKVAAAIVNLFHLLPPSDTFLDPLVTCVMKLEEVLPKYGNQGRLSSPYRMPLTRFLNRYPIQAVSYFLKKDHVIDPAYSNIFQSILRIDLAAPLRKVLTKNGGAEMIMSATFVAASKLAGSSSTSSSTPGSSTTPETTEEPEIDAKVQAQIQVNAQKAFAQALSQAQTQGLPAAQAQTKAKQAQTAYIAKAQAQVSAQQASKAQAQANAQRVREQALAAAQSQGLSPAEAEAKAQQASSGYMAKLAQMRRSPMVPPSTTPNAKLLQAQIQSNATKVYAQALSQAQSQGLQPSQAQERAKQAQNTYIQRANVQAQTKLTTPKGGSTTPKSSSANKVHLDALELHYQGLRLVRLLAKLDPNWLSRQKIMVDCLRKLWRSSSRLQRLISEEQMIQKHQLESKLLVKCLIIYCRVKPDDVQTLFDLLTVFVHRSLIDYSFLKAFYRDEVARTYSPSYKRSIVRLFLRMLHDSATTEELKVKALQLIVLPMLAITFEDASVDNSEIIDAEIIGSIMGDVLGGSQFPVYSESLRIELLQLATLLIEHMGDALLDHRKELIKFAWNHLKSEDTTSKQWAYVNVCRFIAVYETPPKIILQVYVALLRTYQADARDLVRNALDILTPALPKRLPPADFIKAIKWTKKIIYEEGHAVQQLVHIWQLLVRQPALFYGYRAQFVPQMVNSLNRLALPPNSPLENRTLAVALVDLIIAWDQIRTERISSSKVIKKLKVEEGKAFSSSNANEDEFELNSTMVEMIVNFLVRFALGTADVKETEALSVKCVDLFALALDSWPSATVRFTYFDKLLSTMSSAGSSSSGGAATSPSNAAAAAAEKSTDTTPSIATFTAVLRILETLISPRVLTAQEKSASVVMMNLGKVQRVLEPCFDLQNDELQAHFQTFVLGLVKLNPPSTTDAGAVKLFTWLKNAITKRCMSPSIVEKDPKVGSDSPTSKKGSSPSTELSAEQEPLSPLAASENLRCSATPSIELLNALAKQHTGAVIEHFVPGLLRLAQKLSKEHLQAVMMSEGAKDPTLEGSTGGAQVGVNAGPHSRDFVMATPTLALLSKHVKGQGAEYISDTASSSASSNAAKTAANSETSVVNRQGDVVKTLLCCFELLFQCEMPAIEHRRTLLTLLIQCIEKSRYIPLLISISKKISTWLTATATSSNSTVASMSEFLTTKDRALFLSKMNLYDRLDEIEGQQLFAIHRDLIYKLAVKNDKLDIPPANSPPHLGGPYMISLLAPDIHVRHEFFRKLVDTCPIGVDKRLEFIFQQDWQGCGTRLWTVAAVELLLDAIDTNARPKLSSSCEAIPPFATNDKIQRSDQVLKEQKEFIEANRSISVADLIAPIRDLCHLDVELTDHLWLVLFPMVWGTLERADQEKMTDSLTILLSKRYHRRRIMLPEYQTETCNVIRTILRGMTLCDPHPNLPAELILFLAKTYNAWNYVVPLCEAQVLNTCTTKSDRERWVSALSTIYKELNQDDLRVGLCHRFSLQSETRLALSLEVHGMVKEAQDEYFKVMCKAHGNRIPSTQLTKFEMKIWEERWVDCARHLNQWQLLYDFSRSVQNQELMLESSWKRGDWSIAKQLLNTPSLQANTEAGCPETRLRKLYVAIHDGQKPLVDLLMNQTMHLALHQWKSLPSVLSVAHVPLLHLFHKFSELQESAQMMTEMQSANSQRQLPDFKNTLSTWRERLPNKWDSIVLWDDILTWRSHMFQMVTQTFNWADAQHLACMHDNPWSVIKLAHTARKQNLNEVCLSSLAKLYSVSTMDVHDAFTKLREQVILCYERPSELRAGLNIINNTNLDYFNPQQKAELFRLKAKFLDCLGGKNEANQSFSHCLQICDSYAKGWLSWGIYCDRLFADQKQIEFAVQAMACYLQAVHHRSNSARMMLSRVLWLLSSDDDKGTLAHAFEAHGKQLPIWIWIIWIPQLLTALSRPEAPQVRGLLRGVAAKFPQALYYTMRAFLLEKREIPMEKKKPESEIKGENISYYSTKSNQIVAVSSKLSSKEIEAIEGLVTPALEAVPESMSNVVTLEHYKASLEGSTKNNISSMQYTEDLMGFLRRSHPKLAFELETMLEEVIIRFRPQPEEELLSALHALLVKCYQLPQSDFDQAIPMSLKTTLERVSRKFFTLKQDHTQKHEEFVQKYRESFHQEFKCDPESEGANKSCMILSDVVDKLKKWKHILLWQVKLNPRQIHLEQCSRQLIEFSSRTIEIPGQYVADKEPMTDLHVKLQQFQSDVTVLHRNGFSQRRLTMIGHNGREYSFLVQFAIPYTTRTDERIMQMHLLFNQLFAKFNGTRKRDLTLRIPLVVPITPRVRLMADDKGFVSLGEVYESDCIANGTDIESPLSVYREEMKKARDTHGLKDRNVMLKAQVETYDLICQDHVSDTILTRYLHGVLPTLDHYLQFRHEFTRQLALSCFLQYILAVGERNPHRVAFSRQTGRFLTSEFRPGYNSQGLIERSEAVPFRMTRNIHRFMTTYSIEGPFANAITNAAQSLSTRGNIVGNQLSLFFRDDLLSWHVSKTTSRPESELQRIEQQLKDRVQANVQRVLEQIESIAPKPSGSSTPAFQCEKIYELINTATDKQCISQMGPTWAPWL